jgi:hypothetical protein
MRYYKKKKKLKTKTYCFKSLKSIAINGFPPNMLETSNLK